MRRQRFVHTLPSQDDSTILSEFESASIISSQYPYSDTTWSSIIDPDLEPFFPVQLYPYPFYPIHPEQIPLYPISFTPPLPPTSVHSLENSPIFSDDYIGDVSDFVKTSPVCNSPFGDGCFPEDYSFPSVLPEEIEPPPKEIQHACPKVTEYGAVTILLRHLVRVDVSPTKGVYVTNPPSSCVAAINGTGEKSCAIHPNGRVYHDGPEIHVSTLNRKAKICKRGVIFTSAEHCLSYIVDASGTKTTAEKFRDMKQDFSLEVFYNYSMSQQDMNECYSMVNEAEYRSFWNGDEVWLIGGYRIKQDIRGDVKITRNGGRQFIRSSPTTGQVVVKTHNAEFSIGRYAHNYFYVRRGDKQVSANVKGFNVQNGTQKAGFNKSGKVVLF